MTQLVPCPKTPPATATLQNFNESVALRLIKAKLSHYPLSYSASSLCNPPSYLRHQFDPSSLRLPPPPAPYSPIDHCSVISDHWNCPAA